jgi:hypothetical protein
MVVLGEKLGGGPVDQSTNVLEIVPGALFLGTSRVRPTLLTANERLPRTWTATKTVRVIYVDWRGKRTCHVYRVFPCRVYIDSNRRDSRI